MRIRAGQLICLALGVFFLSLGGGLLGGRLAAEKHREDATGRRNEPTAGPAISAAKEASEPEPQEPPPAASETTEKDGRPDSSKIVSAPLVPTAEEPTPVAQNAAPALKHSSGEARMKYVVQAQSTSRLDDARASRKKIMAAGFPAGVVEADLPGKGKWYRVYVGPYGTESEARRALADIKDIPGFRDSFLKNLE